MGKGRASSPSTSLTLTSFQNRRLSSPDLPSPPEGFCADRIPRACLSISACLLLRATRSRASASALGTGGSGGGPVPHMGTTLACCAAVVPSARHAPAGVLGRHGRCTAKAILVGGFISRGSIGRQAKLGA